MNHRLLPSSVMAALALSVAFSSPWLRAVDASAAPTNSVPVETPAGATPAAAVATPAASPATPADKTVAAPADTGAAAGPNPATYTVVSGDTLWGLSHKFNTSIKKIKKLNNLKKNNLKPGQVLKIPPANASTTSAVPASTSLVAAAPAATHTKKSARHKLALNGPAALKAQPVQDFDIPASTFASCPVPPNAASGDEAEPAVARLVPSSSSIPAHATLTETVSPQPAPAPISSPIHSDSSFRQHASLASASPSSLSSAAAAPAPVITANPAPRRSLWSRLFNPNPAPASSDLSLRLITAARDLGNQDISYDESWCPPGESHAWAMDCSNTARYLYKVTTGIQLPRTASDQYYYLHLQNKAWDVPQTSSGFADCEYLRQNLKPGDLLFWENTYRPERQPPITHVMVFLGTNDRNQWIMAGSQTSRGGEHNRRHGGPDIYVFDPTKACGGYTTWLGFVHHQGRFCAFGRPLDADASKLAVAAND